MHSPAEVAHVLRLAAEGLNLSEISRATGLSRATIRSWLRGDVPRAHHRLGGGEVCERCGHGPHERSPPPGVYYAYLLGLYLGDGCISAHARGVFRLRIVLDASYPGIVASAAEAMRAVVPASVATPWRRPHENSYEVYSYSKQWPCLFPQHGPGLKHARHIDLVGWQRRITHAHPQELIRGLIHSDGTRCLNPVRHGEKRYAYVRYQFTQVSEDIKAIFCEHLDLLGIEWRRIGDRSISVARRASVAKLDSFVGPKR